MLLECYLVKINVSSYRARLLVGAAFLSLSSVLSKVIIPGALFPVGMLPRLLGAFLLWIILNNRGDNNVRIKESYGKTR